MSARARYGDPGTSQEAGELASARVLDDVRRVIARRPVRGAIADEVVRALPGTCPSSISRRLTDLRRAGLIVDSGQRRPSQWGRDQIVWRVPR